MGQLAALSTAPFLMVLGNSMLIPVLPTMRKVMDLTPLKSGLIITAFSAPAAISIALAGYLADRYGRKAVIVPSLITYGIGGLVAAAAAAFAQHPYAPLIVGRVIQGVGASGTAPIAMALAGDIYQSSERTKALGVLESANGMGKVASPILGSIAALASWYTPFLVYGILSIPAAALIWRTVNEPNTRTNAARESYLLAVKDIASKNGLGLIISYFAGMVALFVLFGMLFYASDSLESAFRVDGVLRGVIISIPVLVMTVTSYFTGVKTQGASPSALKIIAIIGLALVGAASVGAAYIHAAIPSLLFLSGIGMGSGLVLPCVNTIVAGAASGEQRGIVMAGWGAARFIGVALGPPVFGLMMQLGRCMLCLGTAGLALAALVLVWGALNANRLLAGWDRESEQSQPVEKPT